MAKANTSARKVAMSLMAHPDDCEFMVAGTLALLAEKGWEIHIVTATAGDCGSATLAPGAISAIRREEGCKAAAVIGAHYHCLELRDMRVVFDHDSIERACRVTREIDPSIVLTHALQDYMLDHEETAKLARSASLSTIVPNAAAGGIREGATTPYLYYADPTGLVDYYGNEPIATTYVDVSSVIKTKERMLKCHASQRQWLMDFGLDHYVSMMHDGGRKRGSQINVKFAEGFRQHKGLAYPKDCILTRELGPLVVTRGSGDSAL